MQRLWIVFFFVATWSSWLGSTASLNYYDTPSNTTEIIQSWGYPCTDHEAITPDGWVLSIQHIPHGIHEKYDPKVQKPVVFFQHGLIDSSVGISLNNPQESLVYILADNGYDVWLGNSRGNGYSMKHTHYNPNQDEFWDFSWDDMAAFDLPTQINYVLEQTGATQLSYIGHSQGTTQAFAGFLDQKLASKVNIFIALAPVAYLGNTQSLLLRVLSDLGVDKIIQLIGFREFYVPSLIEILLPGVCKISPTLCEFSLSLVCGPTTYLNKTRLSYYLGYEPNPTSVKNMVHWAQQTRYGTFRKYDYGSKGNQQHYNQTEPPAYDLTKFPRSLPVALFSAGQDYLGNPKDTQILLSQLPGTPLVHYEADYAHLDPLLGFNANERIYSRVLDLLDQYN